MLSKISALFLLMSFLLYSQTDIRILSSDASALIFEYIPSYTDTSVVQIDGKEYRRVTFSGSSLVNSIEPGLPIIEQRIINVGVPSEFGTTIELLSSSYTEISGSLPPIPEIFQDGDFPGYRYIQSLEYFSHTFKEDILSFGEYGISRGLKIQSFLISPVQFNASSSVIRLYSRMLIRINFGNSAPISRTPADDYLRDVILNFEVARYWAEDRSNRLNKVLNNSVLSTGRWIRFEAPEEGIYRITRPMLASFGIDANTVDPRTIKIYNNGGKILPENINQPRPQDLVENAIIVFGEEDGVFNENDYILFYGRGHSFWDFDPSQSRIARMRHTYSDRNYFWITSGGSPGKRVQQKPGLNDAPAFIQNSTVAFADWEVDKINLGKTGRQFVGDDFSSAISSRNYMNNLTHRVNSEPINYRVRFVVGTSTGMELIISENGNQVASRNAGGFGSTSYTAGTEHLLNFSYSSPLPDNRSVLTFKVNPSTVSSVGYLDFFEIDYVKELRAANDYLMFFSAPNTGLTEYQLNGFTSSNIRVFDVSDYANVQLITNYSFLSGGECRFRIEETNTFRKKYIAVGSDIFRSPINPFEISNSNLRGESTGAKFIIITHKNFESAANRLKDYRQNQDITPLSTIIVDIDNIYNEFSGGLLDPTAMRDYLKYVYDNWQIEPEYVLFFGKGTYDYRNIEGYGDNFIPTWQTTASIGLLDSYTTDDFFVLLDGNSSVSMAFGRLPFSSVTEAHNVIDKIIDYEQNLDRGSWQNLITLIADDGIGSQGRYEGSEHSKPTEEIAEQELPAYFDKNKIYAAAYPDVITGQGRRKPAVNQAIIEAINNGTLFINFIGHGSPELWAHEYIFEKSVNLPLMQNDKYFFICAATCDFGYFDIPNFQSSTEAMIFIKDRGAIAGISSSRLVFSWENHVLNKSLINNIFKSQRDTLNLPIRIGKAVYLTKRNRTSVNDRKYFLFADPTLRLRIPQYFASVDSVNGSSLNTNVQVMALSRTKIDGVVLRPDNSVWEDFSGEGLLTVFDSERIVRMAIPGTANPTVQEVKQQGGIIFRGRVSVVNGRFSADFVVPKDISYENKNGKIVFYFFDGQSDGIGFTTNIIVGGTDTTAFNDGKGPDIEIYFDDVNYGYSYLVGPNPKLIVKLFDETGLNTTGTGIGHKLEGIINQQENNPIDFTNYFVGDLDAGGRSGQVNYNFNNLGFGDYTLQVKAWDVFNNFSTETTYFTVVNDNELVIRDVYNYPNPFASTTHFTFNQNLTQPIDVKIKIYTIAGRLIREIEEFNISDRFVTIGWDGRDADGSTIANGTYLYKIIVKTVDGEHNSSVLGKLAVIR